MTTVWRPDLKRIRAEIAAEAELELEVKVEASDGDGAKQGTKRKRAPRTKGPCEHGVKYRSKCKVCGCLLYTSPSPRDVEESRMPSSA